jgi:hypothetical protein
MIAARRRIEDSGGTTMEGDFGDIYMRVANIYGRAARVFKTLPALRSFLMSQEATFRQAAGNPVSDLGQARALADTILSASEHYLDTVEGDRPQPAALHLAPQQRESDRSS